MKILYILDLYKPHIGGVEILFENIISRLAEKGNQIIILTSRYDKNLPEYEKISENIEIYRVGHNRYDFMFYSLFKGVKLAKKCDIIHSTTYNSAIPASIIAKLSNKKIVLTVHEIFGKMWYKFMGWKGFFFKMFESLIFKFDFDKYVCVSNYTKNSLRVYFGIDDKKLITIYNGIDYEKWDRNAVSKEDINKIRDDYNLKNNYVGLFFGRSGISKGLRYYIEAIPKIIQEIPDFKAFLIVPESKNNPSNFEKNLIKKLNIEKNIIWINGVNNSELGKYILMSDFVIIPSLAEGFGFAACETCVLGQNLIVTSVASLGEVVSGNINFIEPSSSESILEAVIKCKNGEHEKISEKRFLWNDNVSKTVEVYGEILGNH